MRSNPQDLTPDSTPGGIPATKHLTEEQIRTIDDALAKVGESGLVRLMIEEGRLCNVIPQSHRRFDVLDYKPGMIKDGD